MPRGKRKILEIIKENPGLPSHKIKNETGTTYDTVQTHLTEMVNNGLLKRKAYGKPWCYYYYTKKQYEELS